MRKLKQHHDKVTQLVQPRPQVRAVWPLGLCSLLPKYTISCAVWGAVPHLPMQLGELPRGMPCTAYFSGTSTTALVGNLSRHEPIQTPVTSDWHTRHNWPISRTPILSDDLSDDLDVDICLLQRYIWREHRGSLPQEWKLPPQIQLFGFQSQIPKCLKNSENNLASVPCTPRV